MAWALPGGFDGSREEEFDEVVDLAARARVLRENDPDSLP